MAEGTDIKFDLKIRIATISIIMLLVVVFYFGFGMFQTRARDIKRRSDADILFKALDLYYGEHGHFPDSVDDIKGWDVSYKAKEGGNTSFLDMLKAENFTNRAISDPVNDNIFHYRYQRYAAGSFGCESPFYILQISNFEASPTDIGKGSCPDFDWTASAPNGYTIQKLE